MTSIHQYQPPPKVLQDRIILITGAGAGIGAQAALNFAAHGATVILVGRTLSKLEKIYDAIESHGGPQAAIFPLDLSTAVEHDYSALKEALAAEFGQLDGLLHNAAELGPHTPLRDYGSADWQRVLQVNTTAPFLMTQALLPVLDKSKDASIVMTGSSVGIKGRAYWGAYAVSKAAGENYMQVLADELEGTGHIRINSINPGATRTAMRAAAYPAENPQSVKHPEALMKYYLFLLGPDSRGISGEQFNYLS